MSRARAFSRSVHLGWGLIAALLAAQGCGSREYERRMEDGLKEIQKLNYRAGFDSLLYGPAELAGTPIRLRVPKVFKSALKEGSAVDGKVVDPRRVKVPFMDLPGLAITYEATIDDAEQGKMPYYLYLAAVDVKTADPLRSAAGRGSAPGKTGGKAASRGSDRMDESGALYESLKRAFPKTTSNNWQDVQCPTPDGGEVTWQKIRATGDQVFYYVDSTGRRAYPKMPGTFELYALVEANYLVIIAWRMPTDIEAHARLSELAPKVAGSISSQPQR